MSKHAARTAMGMLSNCTGHEKLEAPHVVTFHTHDSVCYTGIFHQVCTILYVVAKRWIVLMEISHKHV